MDRVLQRNVMAMSGRAVEAAGDVDVLLLDKTGTITLGNRMATAFLPAPGIKPERLADAAQLASLADETPEGRSIVVLAKEKFDLRAREVAAAAREVRPVHRADAHERRGFSGAATASPPAPSAKARRRRSAFMWIKLGGTVPASRSARAWTKFPAPAARRSSSRKAAKCSASFI